MIPPPPSSTLFPYTTLFRSHRNVVRADIAGTRHQVFDEVARPVAGVGIIGLGRFIERVTNPHPGAADELRSEEHTSELQSLRHLVCRLLLEKKKIANNDNYR